MASIGNMEARFGMLVKSLLCLTPLLWNIHNKINAISSCPGVINGSDFTRETHLARYRAGAVPH